MLSFMAFFILQSSYSQEKENDNSDRIFGLGVSLFNIVEYAYEQPNSFYITINLGSKFRIEPKVGFVFSEGFEEYSLGIGAFGIKPISKFKFLYGLRVGYGSNEAALVAPTLGGEYYIIKNFSIGSEVQLQSVIDEDVVVLTNSSVIVRFYF